LDDPRTVIQALRKFKIIGDGREKVVSLRNEALWLDLTKNPIAFCFLLRSMFEISAKAYCDERIGKPGAPTSTYPNGKDKQLLEVLEEIYDYMINPPGVKKDSAKERHLFGAMQAIKAPASVLSVTSMNQLVHNRRFSVRAGDVSVMFHNIFPLLEALNRP
jgi:hypothetical protein